MALFHLSVTQTKRSAGQSAIASAAYRAGERLYSEYYGEYSDYTRKGGVICSDILLPSHAPPEYADRQTLWNAVEKAERGKNAQLAYSFDIALQNEFSLEENIALARQFLLENFVSRGMVVDFAVHQPDREDGGIPNPHFHVLCPMDEFFRQNDPQYAAEHPEAHAAKEAIYESLMAGRISALEEKLAALGQTQEDYLPSEIEKFKDATGYEEFLDFDPAEVKAALEDPDRSRVDEMLAAAEKAEREYAAEAAAYAQTPAAIVEQARAARDEPVGSFSIYQLKGGSETLDYRFEPLDSIHRNGLSVKPENYELVYEAPMTEKDNLESIYTRFNVDRPADFTGHSLSVSDIVVLHQDGKDTAHYCDRVGFSEVPEFLQERQPELTPDDLETGERIRTPRGSFYVTAMSREQMEAVGYGVHHISDDGKYLIMGNGTRAFAVAAEQPEKDNPLRTAEMTLEDDYGMIDGVINNGRRGEELEKAKEHAERTQPEKKPSIRERLAAAKQECAKQQPRPAPEKKPPELGEL